MRVEGDSPRSWWRRFWVLRRCVREARRHLQSLFDDPALLRGTSLRASHRGRVDLYGIELQNETLHAYTFTILRHPRPYPFSKQFHEVVESYRYELPSASLKRGRSLNLSRLKNRDGEPSGGHS